MHAIYSMMCTQYAGTDVSRATSIHHVRVLRKKRTAAANAEISDALDQIADLLEIERANSLRVLAYRNAARVVRGLGTEVGAMLARGEKLTDLPGIGKDFADKIGVLARTAHLPLLDELR